MYIGTMQHVATLKDGTWYFHPKSGHLVRVYDGGHQHGYTPDAARYSPLVGGTEAWHAARKLGYVS